MSHKILFLIIRFFSILLISGMITGCQNRPFYSGSVLVGQSTNSPSTYTPAVATKISQTPGNPVAPPVPLLTTTLTVKTFPSPTPGQTPVSGLLDLPPQHPQSPAGLAVDVYPMNLPLDPEGRGYDQVHSSLGNSGRWGEPGYTRSMEIKKESANNALAPFGYRLEGTFVPPEPVPYKMYKNDRLLRDDINWFDPVSVNRSKNDFMMVIGTSSQGTKLIQAGSISDWKDMFLWAHPTAPIFLGDDVLYADMSAEGTLPIIISVYKAKQIIYQISLSKYIEQQSPLIGVWTYGGHWALEIKDSVIIDGRPVNPVNGYQKSYEFHLLGGTPVYFFEKNGKVNLNASGEVIQLDGYLVPHGNCCSLSLANPMQSGDLLIFFLNKNATWYYVEIEPEVSIQPNSSGFILTPTMVYLEGSTLSFHCLESERCFPNIDLGEIVKSWKPGDFPIRLDSAYFVAPDIIYTFLVGNLADGRTINQLMKIHASTGQTQLLDLASTIWAQALSVPVLRHVVGGKMVLGASNSTSAKIGIVEDDFTIKEIDLNHDIFGFIDVDGINLLAYGNGETKDGKTTINASFVNSNTGVVQEKSFPPIPGYVLTISSDLRYAYTVFDQGVGMFDLGSGKLIHAIPGGQDFEGHPFDQYHGLWYYYRWGGSNAGASEGYAPARLLDMATLNPVLDAEQLVKDEASPKLLIGPFGKNLLLGTYSRVMVLSPAYTIQKTYNLPPAVAQQDWVFLEYRSN